MNYQDLCFPSKRDILSESKKEQLRQQKLDEDFIDDMVFSDSSAGSPSGRKCSFEQQEGLLGPANLIQINKELESDRIDCQTIKKSNSNEE